MEYSAAEDKKELNDILFRDLEGTVQSGPFKGMKLPREESWDDGNLSCKLLGCYEQELHDFLEKWIAQLNALEQPRISVIGCAEGYYAVGMRYRIPHAKVIGVDIVQRACDITQQAAQLNGVDVITDQNAEHSLGAFNPHLVIMDCEGAENELLNPRTYQSLLLADILVEAHDFLPVYYYDNGVDVPSVCEITGRLLNRFKDTHDCIIVNESGRNPNIYKILQEWHSHGRWLAVSEARPVMMHWIIMRAKRPHDPGSGSFFRDQVQTCDASYRERLFQVTVPGMTEEDLYGKAS